MAVVLGQSIGQKVADALGLPLKNIRAIEIRMAVNEVVTVTCEYHPDIDSAAIEAAFAEYEVVKKDA